MILDDLCHCYLGFCLGTQIPERDMVLVGSSLGRVQSNAILNQFRCCLAAMNQPAKLNRGACIQTRQSALFSSSVHLTALVNQQRAFAKEVIPLSNALPLSFFPLGRELSQENLKVSGSDHGINMMPPLLGSWWQPVTQTVQLRSKGNYLAGKKCTSPPFSHPLSEM